MISSRDATPKVLKCIYIIAMNITLHNNKHVLINVLKFI